MQIPPLVITACLLAASNIFMTFAWYWHLRGLKNQHLLLAILVSWGIAFLEYCLMVPANRIGHAGGVSLGQLKILQEVITLSVFVPFALMVMRERLGWDYLWAACCLVGAAWFVFRAKPQ